MSINLNSSQLTTVDTFCDYIPVVSTATNAFYLFQKYVYMPTASEEIAASPLYSHIDAKNTYRCVALLFPVIGNLAVALYDISVVIYNFMNAEKDVSETVSIESKDDSEATATTIESPRTVTPQGDDNEETMLTLIKQDVTCFQHASERLRGVDTFVLHVVQVCDWDAIKDYVSTDLKNDEIFMQVVGKTEEAKKAMFG